MSTGSHIQRLRWSKGSKSPLQWGTARDQIPGLHGGDRPALVRHKFSSLYYCLVLWKWRNLDATQELPHADAAPNVHTNAKDKLRLLLLTPPFAEDSNPGLFATLRTIQPLSHMWLHQLIIETFTPESKSTWKSLWLLIVPIVSAVQMVLGVSCLGILILGPWKLNWGVLSLTS